MYPEDEEDNNTAEQDLPPGVSLEAQIAEWRAYKEWNDTRGFTDFDKWVLGQLRIRL